MGDNHRVGLGVGTLFLLYVAFFSGGVAAQEHVNGTGACCMYNAAPNDTCGVCDPTLCAIAGGYFVGNGTDCANDTCGEEGACCLSEDICLVCDFESCEWADGVFLGPGVQCDTNHTCPVNITETVTVTETATQTVTATETNTGTTDPTQTETGTITVTETFTQTATATTDPSTTEPEQNGACCRAEDKCVQITEEKCGTLMDTFFGVGVPCGVNGTCPGNITETVTVTRTATQTGTATETNTGSTDSTQTETGTVTITETVTETATATTDPSTTEPEQNGACCRAEDKCVQITEEQCDTLMDTFFGVGVPCGVNETCPGNLTETETATRTITQTGTETVTDTTGTGTQTVTETATETFTRTVSESSSTADTSSTTVDTSTSTTTADVGGCCVDNGCIIVDEQSCQIAAGFFLGIGTDCANPDCPTTTTTSDDTSDDDITTDTISDDDDDDEDGGGPDPTVAITVGVAMAVIGFCAILVIANGTTRRRTTYERVDRTTFRR